MTPDTATPSLPPTPPSRRAEFRFDGDAREYFRIWIVNLFLSVVTLGIYSAWAKVRKKRYFAGNTWVAGANFDYHGNPVSILKGRAIAVATFIVYSVVDNFFPKVGYALLLALVFAAPWLVVRTLQFNAANTSHRNVRFHFHGRYPEALAAIAPLIVWPLIGIAVGWNMSSLPASGTEFFILSMPFIAFAAVYPRVVGALKLFHVRHAAFGEARFALDLPMGDFYRIYIAAAVGAFGLLIVGMVPIALMASLSPLPGLMVAWQAVYLGVAAVFLAYTRSHVANLVFNQARMQGGVRFVSTLTTSRLAKIYFGNLLAIAVSFGLLVPWAVIRTARYRASCLALESDGEMDGVLAGVSENVGAAGDEMGELFDVDVSL
ncbi:hypothetical protein DSM104443_00755 [Usitatibacter rugosus]|uniref:DUF898 domain-containing protein n=1 Tax=Usitatibacter rugosus TaxID=2732067 RepID=A0A6M4GRL6_9PROT|nr:YjgN family protein [Usitatibacter rugosus]QJR09705.1 hypothetical protein DSM104443_00755 [Usitatibacter rugosus]